MLCLGIETSCDETGLALVSGGRLVHEIMATQEEVHAIFGGVVPEIASREHLRLIGPLFAKLTDEAGIRPRDIEAVAVARGPGLLGALIVGMAMAKGLCLSTGAALVGVNHLHAHLMAPGLDEDLEFPALGLLVSGGHTQLYRIDSPFSFKLLGRTLDDAAGEAFDKAAKSLNLPYPGGRHVDALGRGVTPDRALFPRPYIDNQSLDFSFSGLKTAVANHVAAHPELRAQAMPDAGAASDQAASSEELRLVCASLNWAVADALRIKMERALAATGPVRSLIVAGGVAANSRIREAAGELAEKAGLRLYLPRPHLCTDNGAMIAYLGEILAEAGYRHGLDLDAVPRGRKVPWDYLQEDGEPA